MRRILFKAHEDMNVESNESIRILQQARGFKMRSKAMRCQLHAWNSKQTEFSSGHSYNHWQSVAPLQCRRCSSRFESRVRSSVLSSATVLLICHGSSAML